MAVDPRPTIIVLLEELRRRVENESEEDKEKHEAEISEIMVLLQEIKAWIQRNKELKKESALALELLTEHIQDGMDKIVEMLDEIVRDTHTIKINIEKIATDCKRSEKKDKNN